KRRRGQPTKGNKSVRTILVEAAWAATHAKGTFLQAKYQRLVKRMPKQKAVGASAHRLLVFSSHLLRRRVPYAELGTVPLRQQEQVSRERRRLVEQLATLGVTVTVEEAAVAPERGRISEQDSEVTRAEGCIAGAGWPSARLQRHRGRNG